MKILKPSIAIFLIATTLFSCQKEDDTQVETKGEVSKEVLSKISNLSLNTNGVTPFSKTNLDGSKENGYLIEGCIAMSKDHLNSMQMFGGITSEQYRTTNLVSAPRTISVIGYTGGTNALTTNMRNGLQAAINRYNNLGLTIRFTLSFSTSTSADIVVYRQPSQTGAGGQAGFPSGGAPYKWVQIYAGLDNYSSALNSHVIAHEIGHCIGFRHTDWFSRQSCGQNTNEGTAGVGAVHIPGTPTGYDSTSYMRACFNGSETGAFNSNDVTALNYLY
jgi:hypothetical protein